MRAVDQKLGYYLEWPYSKALANLTNVWHTQQKIHVGHVSLVSYRVQSLVQQQILCAHKLQLYFIQTCTSSYVPSLDESLLHTISH